MFLLPISDVTGGCGSERSGRSHSLSLFFSIFVLQRPSHLALRIPPQRPNGTAHRVSLASFGCPNCWPRRATARKYVKHLSLAWDTEAARNEFVRPQDIVILSSPRKRARAGPPAAASGTSKIITTQHSVPGKPTASHYTALITLPSTIPHTCLNRTSLYYLLPPCV